MLLKKNEAEIVVFIPSIENGGVEKNLFFKTYTNFAKEVISSKQKLIKIFKKIKKNNCTIVGYEASAKAVTILNFCNIDNSYVDYFLDTTKQKIRNYLPGTDIAVKKYKKLKKIRSYMFF